VGSRSRAFSGRHPRLQGKTTQSPMIAPAATNCNKQLRIVTVSSLAAFFTFNRLARARSFVYRFA
jgi:hypothetical protein